MDTTRRLALWLVPVPEVGGVARHVLDVARTGLPGWSLTVLCPEGALAQRLRAQGSDVVTAPFGTDYGFARSVRTLVGTLRRLRPRVVHSHLAFADVVAAAVVAAQKSGRALPGDAKPPVLVTTEHGIAPEDSTYQTSRLRATTMNLIHVGRMRITDGKIAVSQSTRRVMERKWRARGVRVVRNGIDAAAVRAAVGTGGDHVGPNTRFLTLSRLAPEKRIDAVIAAFAVVREARPEATLRVGGEGPQKAELEALARDLGVDDAVTFSGFVDPYEALSEADVLVQISEWENYSYTLLDAVAAGKTVVANDVGGNREILGPSGVLPAGASLDEPSRLAEALLAARGSDSVPETEGFASLDRMASEITAVYSSIIPGENLR